MEALGLLKEITELNFLFNANLVYKVLTLINPSNKLLRREDTDFWTGFGHCGQWKRADFIVMRDIQKCGRKPCLLPMHYQDP